MSYGFVQSNDNGRYLIGTDVPALTFVGKASYISSEFASDTTGTQDEWYMYASSGSCRTSFTETAYNAGYYKIYAHDNLGNYKVEEYSVPDEIAIASFSVTCAGTPVVFIRTTEYVSASVLSVTGISGSWTIRCAVTYPIGQRALIPTLELYCFSTPVEQTQGYGLQLKDAQGNVTYNSNQKVAAFRGFITVNRVYVGADHSVGFDYDTSFTGVITKPITAAVDWMRFRSVHRGEWVALGYHSSSLDCRESYKSVVTSFGVGCGFYVSGETVYARSASIYFTGGDLFPNMPYTSPSMTYTKITASLRVPFMVPVLDGADYD